MDGRTLTMRNNLAPGLRQWGMFFTVTNDPTSANNTTWVLVRGLDDNDITNNDNWQTIDEWLESLGIGGGSVFGSTVFDGDGVETEFTLAAGRTPFIVDVGGVTQRPGIDYVVADNVVTMASAPDNGADSVVIHWYTAASIANDPLQRVEVDTSGNIVIDMDSRKDRMFTGSDPITAHSELSFSNAANALRFTFFFEIAAGGTEVLTLPDTFILDDGGWDDAEKEWTPSQAGAYKMVGEFDGTNWHVEIHGPKV